MFAKGALSKLSKYKPQTIAMSATEVTDYG